MASGLAQSGFVSVSVWLIAYGISTGSVIVVFMCCLMSSSQVPE